MKEGILFLKENAHENLSRQLPTCEIVTEGKPFSTKRPLNVHLM